MRLLLALLGSLVKLLVIRERMRIGTRHVRMHQRGTFSRAAMFGRPLQRVVADQRIGAVALLDVQVRVIAHQPRNASARGLHLHRHGDSPAVVFDQEQHRQALQASGIQRLEEFSLAGHPFAAGDVDDLVPAVPRRAPLWGVLRLIQRFRMTLEIDRSFRRAHRVQPLHPGRRGPRNQVQLRLAPMRRHLMAAGGRIGLCAHGLQKHLLRRQAQTQAQRPVAVVGEKPILAGPQNLSRRHQYGLVSRPADLKVDLMLSLELDFAVVQPPRTVHQPVHPDEVFRLESVVLSGIGYCRSSGALAQPCSFTSVGKGPGRNLIITEAR